jgi:beta-glucosidase
LCLLLRKNLTAWLNGDALVQAVAAQNNNTVVVVHSVGPLILEPWIDHPNVTAVVWAGLGGTETGNALLDVMYGVVNPSGRLPYTIAKSPSDYPAQLVKGGNSGEVLNISYSEGWVCLFSLRPADKNYKSFQLVRRLSSL